MLFEMATGNISFRMNQGVCNDELDELAGVLNIVAATLQNTMAESGYVTPYYSYQSLTQNTLVLDKDFQIESFNAEVLLTLNYNVKELIKLEFDKIIAPQSKAILNNLKQEITLAENYHTSIQLIFITGNKKVIPAFCTVTKLLNSDKIIISSITTVLQHSLADITPLVTGKGTTRKNEGAIIQNLYEYIINHLEDPLPTTKELSKLFGTNEFKLKEGFKEAFNTSIYQYYNSERLKRAQHLIQQTEIPLKEIAFLCGFNDYTNFYKAFKKKFSYTPSDIKRGEIKNENDL